MKKSESPKLELVSSTAWEDYELLDSGAGKKLERFEPYRFVRPETQAVWKPALPPREWDSSHMIFEADGDEEGAGWKTLKKVEERWPMRYRNLKFWASPTPFRHMGVFPEQAAHWDWITRLVENAGRPVKVLNLFGYTGLATLAAASAGAAVTHLDASKKAVTWARENQALSELGGKPIRWILDDALKFVRREKRRGVRYDGILMDPPKFGRGPKGELWKLEESLPPLMADCGELLSASPLFAMITVYSFRASALSLHHVLAEMTAGLGGASAAGENIIVEKSAGRSLSTSVFARWASA